MTLHWWVMSTFMSTFSMREVSTPGDIWQMGRFLFVPAEEVVWEGARMMYNVPCAAVLRTIHHVSRTTLRTLSCRASHQSLLLCTAEARTAGFPLWVSDLSRRGYSFQGKKSFSGVKKLVVRTPSTRKSLRRFKRPPLTPVM